MAGTKKRPARRAFFMGAAVGSVRAGQVEEPTLVVVIELGEVVAELGEVVAQADAEVVADMTVETDQEAVTFAVVLVNAQPAILGQRVPLVHQLVAGLDG